MDRKVRILCLDGGGVKGVTSLRILQRIMEQISIEEHERAGSDQPRSEEPLKPCDYFDLICGTGTGGLIATLLGRLEYTLEEAIMKYEEFAEKIFSKKLSWFNRWDATYDHIVFEKLFKEYIRESPLELHEDAALKDASRPCKTFIITTKLDKHSLSSILMRSYALDEDKESSIKIWEAVRATSAAPNCFKPITINNERYIDGGTIANNPSHLAIMEAAKIWKLDDIGCIKFAAQLGLSKMGVVAHEKTVFVLPSHKIIHSESIVEINLTIGDDKNMHIETFSVVNDDDMQADIILGFEFTMKHKTFGRNATTEEPKNLSQAKKGGIEAVRLPRNARKSNKDSSLVPVILNGDNSWKGTSNSPLYGEIAGLPIYGEIVDNIAFLDTRKPDGKTSATKIAHEAILEEVVAREGNDADEQSEDEKDGLEEKKGSEDIDIDEKDENGQTVLSQAAKDGDEALVKKLLKIGKWTSMQRITATGQYQR
ncbi:acyl transferase acyl hydrolase lysophospholipase protein [Rutstroemia sp. NJR-2017a WRK4]|nr:acyl transferase acyl hydrolase lysophospholipase protein [Rutstroemia sp. NJR-2017a WRK4]